MIYNIVASGKRIRQLRKAKGMTQEQLAIKLGIGDRYLRKIEAGEKVPSIDILVGLSSLLDISMDYIITGKQPQDDIKQKLCAVIQNLSKLAKEL